MVKRSTIGAILGAVALGIVASIVIRNPSGGISPLGPAPPLPTSVISTPLDFSAPLPFKSIAQQRAEFDFGIQEFTIGSTTALRQTSCSGGRSCISGGDINRAKSAFRQQFLNVPGVMFEGFRAFVLRPTNVFKPELTTV